METVTPQEKEFLKSHGWYSHLVLPEEKGRTWVDYHTHGLPEHYGHLDFQFVLPIDGDLLHELATRLVDRVKKGERFTAGSRVSGIMQTHDVLLIETTETQSIRRKVLRVILPDKNGNLDRTLLSGLFAQQFLELPN